MSRARGKISRDRVCINYFSTPLIVAVAAVSFLSTSSASFAGVILLDCLYFWTLARMRRISRRIKPRSLLPTTISPGSSVTKRRTRILKMLPNASAITVELRIITLYGILKSGVGKFSNSDVVRRTPPPTTVIIAGLRLNDFDSLHTQHQIPDSHRVGTLYTGEYFYQIPMSN